MHKDLSVIDKGLEDINEDNVFSLAVGSTWDKIGKYFDKLDDKGKELAQQKISEKLSLYLVTNLTNNLCVPSIPENILKRFKVEKVVINDIQGSVGTFRTSLPKVRYPVMYKVSVNDLSHKLNALSRAGMEHICLPDTKATGSLLENIDRISNDWISRETKSLEK